MSKVFIEETTLSSIGDAIREKTGKSALIAPGDMPSEIESITTSSGGGDSSGKSYIDGFSDSLLTGKVYFENRDYYNDKVVTLRDGAFRELDLDTVTLPNVTEIGDFGFYGCKATEINLVKFTGVQSRYMTQMFANSRIEVANIPEMRYIPWYCFYGCVNLKEINFPEARVTGSNSFEGCTEVTKINLPEVIEIDSQSFQATGVTKVKLPKAQIFNGGQIFYFCNRLELVDLPVFGNTELESTSYNGTPGYFNYYAFAYSNLKTLILRYSEKIIDNLSSNNFINTPIDRGEGYIYVPKSLIEEYKVATNWSVYADQFRAIEDYPEICNWEEDEANDNN